jgi:hypothetical protein
LHLSRIRTIPVRERLCAQGAFVVSDTSQNQPIDVRRIEARPERIVVGDEVFIRDDVYARSRAQSRKTLSRQDALGMPYRFFSNVKYRPEKRADAFIIGTIKVQKPTPPKRRRSRR